MKFIVDEKWDGITVKDFLRKHCNVSARLLTRLKRVPNGITRDGQLIRSIDTLHTNDEVVIAVPEDENHIVPIDLKVEVVYEDDSVIVYNKPPYMPVHPVHDHQLDTLANFAAYYAQSKGEHYAFRAVNRIDRDTSGLVLCAKTTYAAHFLAHNTDKVYIALCEGILEGSGTIDQPIRLKEGHTIQREIGEGGVRAITHYRVLKNSCSHSLVEFQLETGRTHQIRTHLSGIGHPLAGDDMYGGSLQYFDRQCLHCVQLTFTHPETHKLITVRHEPEDWLGILQKKFLNISSEQP